MILKSKFSKLYLARYYILIPLLFLITLVCTINYFDEDLKLQERRGILIIGLIILALLVALVMDMLNTYRVLLDEEKITAQNVVNNKNEYFYYKDIASVTSNLHRSSVNGLDVNLGHFDRIYVMNDGRLLEISPDVFENYGDIIYTISEYTAHL